MYLQNFKYFQRLVLIVLSCVEVGGKKNLFQSSEPEGLKF